jgi:hypothetical protein
MNNCSGPCWLCINGDPNINCLAGRGDDYFQAITPEKVKERLDKKLYPSYRNNMTSWLEERGIHYDDKPDQSQMYDKVKEYEEKYIDKKHYTDPDDSIAVEYIESVKDLFNTPLDRFSSEEINKFIQLSLNYIKNINGFPGVQEVNSIMSEAYADAIGIINYALEKDLLTTKEEPEGFDKLFQQEFEDKCKRKYENQLEKEREQYDKFVRFADYAADLVFSEDIGKEFMCELLCRRLCDIGLIKSEEGTWIYPGISSDNIFDIKDRVRRPNESIN